MQKMRSQDPNSNILHFLPIETVPTIKPKNQLAFAVEVSALPVDQRLRVFLPGIARVS